MRNMIYILERYSATRSRLMRVYAFLWVSAGLFTYFILPCKRRCLFFETGGRKSSVMSEYMGHVRLLLLMKIKWIFTGDKTETEIDWKEEKMQRCNVFWPATIPVLDDRESKVSVFWGHGDIDNLYNFRGSKELRRRRDSEGKKGKTLYLMGRSPTPQEKCQTMKPI